MVKEGNSNMEISFMENLFDLKEKRLIAGKCKKCGQMSFPIKRICHKCWNDDFERIFLSSSGRIYTFTVCWVAPPNLKAPYAAGYIDLPEGLRVFSLIEIPLKKDLHIGTEVEITAHMYATDDQGRKILVYKFQPIE